MCIFLFYFSAVLNLSVLVENVLACVFVLLNLSNKNTIHFY